MSNGKGSKHASLVTRLPRLYNRIPTELEGQVISLYQSDSSIGARRIVELIPKLQAMWRVYAILRKFKIPRRRAGCPAGTRVGSRTRQCEELLRELVRNLNGRWEGVRTKEIKEIAAEVKCTYELVRRTKWRLANELRTVGRA